jgi:hypothetical protein
MLKRKGPGIKIGFCDRYDVGADWRRSSCSLEAPPPHEQLLGGKRPMLRGTFSVRVHTSTGRREWREEGRGGSGTVP